MIHALLTVVLMLSAGIIGYRMGQQDERERQVIIERDAAFKRTRKGDSPDMEKR